MQRIAALEIVIGRRLVVDPTVPENISIFPIDNDRNKIATMDYSHLLAAVDETLLHRRDSLLLFDLFLDLRNLHSSFPCQPPLPPVFAYFLPNTYLVSGLDIQLNLLAGERSHPTHRETEVSSNSSHCEACPPRSVQFGVLLT